MKRASALFVGLLLLFFFKVHAQVVTKTYTAPSSVSIDGSGQFGTALPGLSFARSDFSSGCVINDVNVTIRWAKTDGTCTSPGTGNSFHNETSFRIDGPVRNEALALSGTWSGTTSTSATTTTFDQAAAAIPSGIPVSGTFRPNNGNLNNFNNTSAFGTWLLRAGDNGGGDPLCIISYSVRISTVADNTAPTITCPANITTNVISGCARTVSYSTPTATDNCTVSSITRTAGPASGTSFAVGSTPVTYQATDTYGNQRSCTFTVTVNDNIDPTISCPANVTVNAPSNSCAATVSYATPTASDNCSSQNPMGSQTFSFSGGVQNFTVPAGVTSVTIQAWGAQGGTAGTTAGGRGGFATGTLAVTPGQLLRVYVGGQGTNGPGGQNCNLAGGFNGGGNTGTTCCSNAGGGASAGGGGSDVRVGGTALSNRRIVAGGGAGSGSGQVGADGGGLTGGNGQPYNGIAATGGSQTAGGIAGGHFTSHTCSAGSNGSLGQGGRGDGNDGGGGGGGYYGGGGGANNSGGGGGSSYVGGVTGGSTQSGQRTGNGQVIITWSVQTLSVAQTAGQASGTSFPVGTTTNTYRATDGAGNTADCSFTVTVNDNQNPSIACPANITRNNDNGQCSAVVSYSVPGGSDNCPGASTSRTAGLGSGATFPLGSSTETYRVTDAAGNTASCSFTVTVVDAENPVISCPANITVNSANGQCSRNVNYNAPSGTDNCPSPTTARTSGLASGSSFSVGTATITYTVTDASGNTASCSFSVTVNDNENPTISCPANVSVNNAPGQCSATVNYSTPGGSDNCPGATTARTTGLGSGATFPVGTTTETYRVTDASGNIASCNFTVTVNDNENPAISCPANITRNNDTGQCSAVVAYSAPGGTDNCPGASTARSAGLGSGGTFPVGVTTESYTVTDAAGNTASCSFTVRVNDNEDPAIACPANITQNNDAGQCAAVVSYSPPGGSDNCPGATTARTAGLGSGATFPVGSSTETYTATDAAGNTASCSFTITVMDAEAPVISCPANVTVNSANGQCSQTITYSSPNGTDNCPGAVTTRSAGLGSGSTFPVGTTFETYLVTDASGNTDSCSFSIRVNDNENPVISCPANITVNNDAGLCSAAVNYAAPGGTDNCPGASTSRTAGLGSGAAFPVGTTTESYRVTDAAGNTANCSFTVTVNDNENPAISCPANITVNNDAGQCSAVVSYTTPGGTDNCPGASTSRTAGLGSGGTFPVGTTTENYIVTDAAGNTASCSFTVRVNDNENPVIACPANITRNNDAGQCSAVVSYSAPGGTDNCPGATTARTNGLGSGGTFPVGSTTESYLVTDAAGNTANCSFTVTVNDNENPVISCPANINVNNDAGQCSAVVSYTAPGGTDNCPGASTSRTTGLGSGATFPLGSTTETYTVTDASGNTATCNFTVAVNDNENPIIACPANIIANNDAGLCSAVVNYPAPAGTDNCPGASTALTNGQGSGAAFAVGSSTETYTVTDAAGNTTSCSFTITVNDNENPNALCNNLTVQLDGNGNASTTAAAVNNSSTDNCGIQGVSLNTTSFTCTNLGANTVTLTVNDVNGNSSTCTATITVEDNIEPQAVCQNLTIQLPASGDSTLPAIQVNNGSTDNCTISSYSLSRDRFICSDVGTNPLTLYVTDQSGNVDSCTATITVVDTLGITMRPIDIGSDTTICNQDTLNLDAGAGFNSYVWSTGATSQAIDIYGPGTYDVFATDSIGCTGQDTFTLSVDTVADPNIRSQGGPAILCLNDTLALESDPGYGAYVWSTGDTSRTTQTSTGGNIFLTVTATFGCSRTDTFFIDQRNFPDPNPIIDPGGDTLNLCDTNQVMLNVRGGYISYEWSTGDTSQSIVATPGTYQVTVTNGFGCWNSSNEKVVRQVTPVAPTVQINGDTLCASSGSNFQWYFNGNAIILANGQCYVAAVPGNYWVEVNDLYGCPVNSDTVLLVSTPERVAAGWNVNAFPNPFRESTFITFVAPERSRVVVDVFSLTGVRVKTLMDREVYAGENVKLEFRPEESAAGIYIFRMITESGQTETGKLILQR